MKSHLGRFVLIDNSGRLDSKNSIIKSNYHAITGNKSIFDQGYGNLIGEAEVLKISETYYIDVYCSDDQTILREVMRLGRKLFLPVGYSLKGEEEENNKISSFFLEHITLSDKLSSSFQVNKLITSIESDLKLKAFNFKNFLTKSPII